MNRTHLLGWGPRLAGLVVCAAVALSCGGDKKKADEPNKRRLSREPVDPGDSGDELIDEEKFVEIQATWTRKTTIVSRCFNAGLDAGEVKKTDKGYVTIGVVITRSGKPDNVRVLETSFNTKAIEGCIVDMVRGWEFTDLPRPVESSHRYVLSQF